MKEQHFENSHLHDRFQQIQPPIEQDFNSHNRQRSNQRSRLLENSVNYIQPPQPTVQLPVDHTVNFNQQPQPVVQLPVEHAVNFNQRQQAVQLPVEHIINHNQQRQQAVQLPVEHNDNYPLSNTRAIHLLGGHTVTNTQPTQQPIQQSIQQSTRYTISNVPHQPQGTSVPNRQSPTQQGFNRSSPTVANQPINHKATGQQPPQPNINRSNPLPALRSTPPVRERVPYQQLPPTANRANQPPCPRSTGQLQSTRQQKYTFPVSTAGQQNRVIDNQQHLPPIRHPVNIPHTNSHVPPTQQFNRTGLYQPNTNQSGFQQPFNNTMGQQGQPPQAIHNQQEVYRQQPVQHLQNVTAPIHQTQQPFGNIPYQQERPYQPSTTPNLVQRTAQSGYYDAAPHLPVYPQQQLYNNRPHT
ncbi:protein transport protein SEC24-like [Mytilus trossulus]|uniref:protein transport protein SEC24-like n=1 Tax=Mytilus trossulus TaxID=6551 RepID=UPI003003FCD0